MRLRVDGANHNYQAAWDDYSRAIQLSTFEDLALYEFRAVLFLDWKGAPAAYRAIAIQDARRCCELTKWESPFYVGLLARASAAGGDIAAGFKWASEARRLEKSAAQ